MSQKSMYEPNKTVTLQRSEYDKLVELLENLKAHGLYSREGVINTHEQVYSETVTITRKEYEGLIEDSRFLDHLIANGVDNWEGYSRPSDEDEDEDEIPF